MFTSHRKPRLYLTVAPKKDLQAAVSPVGEMEEMDHTIERTWCRQKESSAENESADFPSLKGYGE